MNRSSPPPSVAPPDNMDVDQQGLGDVSLTTSANVTQGPAGADPSQPYRPLSNTTVDGHVSTIQNLSIDQRGRGLPGTPHGTLDAVPATPAIDSVGPSYGIVQGTATRSRGRSTDPTQAASTPERVAGVPMPSPRTDPPSSPSTPPQQLVVANRQNLHTSQTDATFHGHTTPILPPVTGFGAEPFPAPSHTNDALSSPTTPTPVSSRHQRRRSHSSHTPGQEIPQMLGEMRDVIGNLATSVNGLKDVVSDLQARRSTGFGPTPVRGSGRGRGSRGRRGGNGNRRAEGGVGRGEGSQGPGTGDPVGDGFVADDEGQGDEVNEEKNYKLRVSSFAHVRRLWD